MRLSDIAAGTTVFVDASILIFGLTLDPGYGPACETFLDRVENREIAAVTLTHMLGDVMHRIMTIEACDRFGWSFQGIANRLRKHPVEVQQLLRPRQALDEIQAIGMTILAAASHEVSQAVDISSQTSLLFGDALIVAVMRDQGLSHLASLDSDFDRVPGLTRYTPV